ncbi:SDR family oxidoreductase [Nakamurella sp. YIM 132087]|uniref:SDR family oxidoreductase n=2 Tax=Nakamurella alba TaxID=2665158 RepID=A0A7K1FLF0_9ACTN|nr:SDR family oxidoreductase [Nakamurella alba]
MTGKAGLVTGAGYGIGRGSARHLASLGAQVAVIDRDVERGHETVDMIAADGGPEALFLEADVSDEEQVAHAVAATVAAFGRLDFAHNNAAISPVTGNTVECSLEHWDAILSVNLTGLWLCMKHEIPQMVSSGGGAIVNTSSGVGLLGMSHQPAYVASKHGIIGVTKAAALEFAAAGVRVNAICPGPVLTGLTEQGLLDGKYTLDTLASLNPMKKVAYPDDISGAVAWLCSDASAFVTGVALPVDGGTVAGLPSFRPPAA